eukprot:Filipodium_phascolosomae@DN1802_c0_g1_i3.p2
MVLNVDRDEMLDMEILIVNTLDFSFCIPTSHLFLDNYLTTMDTTPSSFLSNLAHFFLESTLLDIRFTEYRASSLAVGALYLSRKACKLSPTWVRYNLFE